MRTLEEMKQDADHINSNLVTLEKIANLNHSFSPIDIRTYNFMSEATRKRIEEFEQALCEAFENVASYAEELTVNVKSYKVSRHYALGQLLTALEVNEALSELRDRLGAQIDKFNSCLEKAEKHP